MTKFILHGGFTKIKNELNRSYHEELLRNVPEGGTVLLVYFASRSEVTNDDFQKHVTDLRSFSSVQNIQFVQATTEDFLTQFQEADVIHIGGGSTNKLLAILREYPDLRPFSIGKTIAGSSAGAYALAQYGASHTEEVVREGLGFVPVRLVCHYQSPDLPPSDASVALLEKTAPELEMVYLKDFEWKVFTA